MATPERQDLREPHRLPRHGHGRHRRRAGRACWARWLAQLLDAEAACRLAVYLHGAAGELADADNGEVSMTAGDLVEHIGDAVLELTARRRWPPARPSDGRALSRRGSEDETRAFAARLAATLAPGTVLLLSGDLGAGKTAFVKGLAEGLGLDPERGDQSHVHPRARIPGRPPAAGARGSLPARQGGPRRDRPGYRRGRTGRGGGGVGRTPCSPPVAAVVRVHIADVGGEARESVSVSLG